MFPEMEPIQQDYITAKAKYLFKCTFDVFCPIYKEYEPMSAKEIKLQQKRKDMNSQLGHVLCQ